MPFLKLIGLLIITHLHAQVVWAQREILPLPLDKLNRDSINKVIRQKEKEKDYQALGELYGGIYTYFYETKYRDSTIRYAIKAEENSLKAGDSTRYYFTQLHLGELSINDFDLNTGRSYYQKARDYYKRINNYKLLAHSLGGLSGIYKALKDTPNMIKYNNLALESNKIGKDTLAEMLLRHDQVIYSINSNKIDDAIDLIKKNLWLIDNAKTFGNSENIRVFWKGFQLVLLAECYYKKKKFSLAIKNIKEFQKLQNPAEEFRIETIQSYRLLINSYINTAKTDSALKYVDSFYNKAEETITNLNPEKLNDITTKYETEKKERQIEQLEQQNKLHQLQAFNQRKLNFAFISIFCLLLVSSYLIIKNIQQKRKVAMELARQEAINAEQLHKQQELEIRNKISRDLHDDIGATLSSVKAYSEILHDHPDNLLMNDLIRQNADEMIQQLEVIAWSTDPQHDNLKSLTNAMLKFARPISYARKIELLFKQDDLDESISIPGDIRQNILLIFKEAINNMIKYANASVCTVSIFVEDLNLYIEVEDNGIGYDKVIKGGGSGVKNMIKRAEEINAKFEMKSMQGKGTLVSMSIPYPFKIPNSWDNKKNES